MYMGYMQVLGVQLKESFSPVVSDTSIMILIGLTLYYEDDGWIVEICCVELVLLHPNMEVEISIKWIKGIVDLGIITKELLG